MCHLRAPRMFCRSVTVATPVRKNIPIRSARYATSAEAIASWRSICGVSLMSVEILLKRRLLQRRDISDSVCPIGRTEDHDGTSASRTAAFSYEFSLEMHIPVDH